MKILMDENIPFARELFGPIGTVTTISGRNITNKIAKQYDILLVRSVTNVNKDLLKGTGVKFVGTATVGEDHIDKRYLKEHHIGFASAGGSNTHSVVDYVFWVLFNYCAEKGISIKKITLGVVGAGRIGGLVALKAQKIGICVMKNDPPLQKLQPHRKYHSLDDLAQADFITIHTPLIHTGPYPTFHLFNKERMLKMKKKAVLINTARGGVVDNKALEELLNQGHIRDAVLDVWENEPYISLDLLRQVFLGTFHIAGYSFQGKLNGSILLFKKLCDFLKFKKRNPGIKKDKKIKILLAGSRDGLERTVSWIMNQVYDFRQDHERLKTILKIHSREKRAKMFDLFRKDYPERDEFTEYQLKGKLPDPYLKILKMLGFRIS
ncbi:MAG: 4-phosphoerythronate dehydrogenase [Spirochaetes bacterium]|nr:4-phosphoerythronate dehydrogenase [Spirochaetota bacterium]